LQLDFLNPLKSSTAGALIFRIVHLEKQIISKPSDQISKKHWQFVTSLTFRRTVYRFIPTMVLAVQR
jgi:hypothetical protein